ncbi:MAG: OmpA family protein, partial [Alphaproteobacteria bacterium]|nr:OmpA family protein [Alphaproteobacteria bacterium]
LGDVPKLRATTAAEERNKMANSLIADRDHARYTDQNLRAGDKRMAEPTPVPKAKPFAPKAAEQTAVISTTKGTATRLETVRLPLAPTRVIKKGRSLTSVPSIVQRRGSLPPPPTPISEVSRGIIPQIVQKSGNETATIQPVVTSKPAALVRTSGTMSEASPAPVKLIPPAASQVNLPVGQGQSLLAQTYAASLAAQASYTVRRPGNVFNAPKASPIAGQWPTVVPGVVRQAFNASLSGIGQGVQPLMMTQPKLSASPQMSNETMRRLPGAPTLIRFHHGSARLSGKGKQILGQLANQAKKSGKMIYVVGHASQRTGDMDYAKHKLVNFGVSLDRANKVAGELRRKGVSRDKIIVQAKGDSEPLYFEFMPNGEAQNRRVEVFIR